MNTTDRVYRIIEKAGRGGLSTRERQEFLPSVARFSTPTSRQEEILAKIEKRIFGESP